MGYEIFIKTRTTNILNEKGNIDINYIFEISGFHWSKSTIEYYLFDFDFKIFSLV